MRDKLKVCSLFSKFKEWKTVRQAIGDLEGLNDPYPKGKINNVQSRYQVRPDDKISLLKRRKVFIVKKKKK